MFGVIVVVPLVLGLLIAIGTVDWTAVSEASRRGGTDMMSRIESKLAALKAGPRGKA